LNEKMGKVGDGMPVDENELIVQAKTGDRAALNELVAQYWQPVYHFALYKTGNQQDAEEVTQETFIRAFRSLSNYQFTGAAFTTYLKRIAVNLITDFWRKKSRSPALTDIAEHPQLVADEEEPDVQLVSNEMRETIARVLQKLPAEQRQTVELRIIAGLPVRDTALAMGKSEAAVKMLQQRALKNLRTLLIDTGMMENCAGR